MPMSGVGRGRLCRVGWISDVPVSAFAGTLLGIDVLSWLGDCPLTYFSQRDPTGLAWIRGSPADVAEPRGAGCNLQPGAAAGSSQPGKGNSLLIPNVFLVILVLYKWI